MPPHEGNRIETGVRVVPRVEADFQQGLIRLGQKPLQFRLKVDEPRRVGMNAHRQPMIDAQLRHGANAVGEGFPFGRVHLLGLGRPASGRGTAGRNGIDQHQMLRAVCHQRLAGAGGAVPDIVPLGRIMEGAEDDAADQRQVILGQAIGQHRRVFRHEAHGAEFDALVTCRRAIAQHLAPAWIAGVVCEFHAPGTGRIADADHGASRLTQAPVAAEWRAAAMTSATARPSAKVGQTGVAVAMACRKSRASMMIWS